MSDHAQHYFVPEPSRWMTTTLALRLEGGRWKVDSETTEDGASALAEGTIVAVRQTRRSKILVSDAVHPAYRATRPRLLMESPLTVSDMIGP